REGRHSKQTAHLPAMLELPDEMHRCRLAIRLVEGIDPAAIGIGQALIESNCDITRPYALDQVAEKARESKHRVNGVAVAIHDVGQYRVIRAVHIHRRVDQENHAASFRTTSAVCGRAAGWSAGSAPADTPSGPPARAVP